MRLLPTIGAALLAFTASPSLSQTRQAQPMTGDTEHELAALMVQSVVTYDNHDYDKLVALFTEDARYQSPTRGDLIGHAQIREAMSKRPKGRLTRHLLTNIVIRQTGPDTAEGDASIVAFLNESAYPAPGAVPQTAVPAVADYHYRFRKTGAAWRISEKRTQSVFEGNLSR